MITTGHGRWLELRFVQNILALPGKTDRKLTMAKHGQLFVFVCISLAVVWIQLASCNTGPVRDFYVVENHPKDHEKYFPNTFFGKYKKCHAVSQIKDPGKRGFLEERTPQWSFFLDVFLVPHEKMLTKTGKEILDQVSNSFEYWKIRLGIFLYVIVAIFVSLLSSFFIPIIGAIIFFLCENIYHILTHRIIRKIGKRILIWRELHRRHLELTLIKKSGIRRKPPRPRFRMPHFFRDLSDEDIPPELKKPHGEGIESTSSEDFDMKEAFKELQVHEAKTLAMIKTRMSRRGRYHPRNKYRNTQRPKFRRTRRYGGRF